MKIIYRKQNFKHNKWCFNDKIKNEIHHVAHVYEILITN